MLRRAWRLRSLLLFSIVPLSLAALGLRPNRGARIAPTDSIFTKEHWKCPGHGSDTLPQLVVPGEITNVPEYHDCQRFILPPARGLRTGTRYDSLYGIFISGDARRLLDSLRRLECVDTPPVKGSTQIVVATGSPVGELAETTPGLPTISKVGPSVVRQEDCRTRAGRHNAVGLVFAEVVSWGGSYASLGIRPYFNCLYLYDSANLKAIMRPVGRAEKRCKDLVDPRTVEGKRLQVRGSHRRGLVQEDYPAVVRWDSDSLGRKTFVSISCGHFWCEVGEAPFGSSRQYTSSSTDHLKRRVVEVRGWYDEQILARVATDGSGHSYPLPSVIRGTMFPNPGLDTLKESDFTPGAWLPVATVVISGALDKYSTALNLRPLGATLDSNQMFLCKGAAGVPPASDTSCVPAGQLSTSLTCTLEAGDPWYAKIVSTDGSVRFRCVHRYRHTHLKFSIPGVVRWAWHDDDEGGWIRCPLGCCYPG